jgi:hypothetical protein
MARAKVNGITHRALFTGAEPHVKEYYRHLIENNGLKKLQALCFVP